jgi:LacI family transcriptional regulator
VAAGFRGGIETVTIRDVAKLAGVSTTTVSHALNRTRPVHEDTRKRIQAAVEELGYAQNMGARSLRRSRTESIGVMTPDAAQYTFGRIIGGVESEAQAHGLTILLANTGDSVEQERNAVHALQERRVDGLVIAQVVPGSRTIFDDVRRRGVPVVAVDRLQDLTVGVDFVAVDSVQPTRRITQHLLDRGHKKISLVAGDTSLPTLMDRRVGFLQALDASGISPWEGNLLEGTRTIEETRSAVRELLNRDDPPTALVGGSYRLTLGILEAVQDTGLRIPEDIAFVTFDEFPYSKLFRPWITSVVQPAFEIGREAMHLLLRRIAEPNVPPARLLLEPRIEHGTSCGCRAGESSALFA